MSKPLIMIGSGGHASVLMDLLNLNGEQIVAYVSSVKNIDNQSFAGIKYFNNDEDIRQFNPNEVLLVNGVGCLPNQNSRKNVIKNFTELGFRFASVISPSAIVSSSANLARGVQVMHGAIIQAGARIGADTIINTGAIIEHDCIIGSNNHIAPRATLCGGVNTLNDVYVGVNACVIQGLNIGCNAVIAAGSIVTKDINDQSFVYGHRALIIKKE